MWPHQCWSGRKDPLPWPDGNAFPNAAQNAVGCLCHKSKLVVHGQLAVLQDTKIPVCRAAFQKVSPQKIPLCLILQPAWAPANSSTPVRYTNTSLSFVSSVYLLRVHAVQVINENFKQYWLQFFPLGYTISDVPPIRLCCWLQPSGPRCSTDWFSIHCTVHLSNFCFVSSSMRMLWDRAPKALLKRIAVGQRGILKHLEACN